MVQISNLWNRNVSTVVWLVKVTVYWIDKSGICGKEHVLSFLWCIIDKHIKKSVILQMSVELPEELWEQGAQIEKSSMNKADPVDDIYTVEKKSTDPIRWWGKGYLTKQSFQLINRSLWQSICQIKVRHELPRKSTHMSIECMLWKLPTLCYHD